MDAEVPDDYTIASYLQKRINDQGGVKYAVQNVGAEGVNVAQQLDRLKTLDFGYGDVALFDHGTSDAVQGVSTPPSTAGSSRKTAST